MTEQNMDNELVGGFLLRLYRKRILKDEFLLKKSEARIQFRDYLQSIKFYNRSNGNNNNNYNCYLDVGTALRMNQYLINTPRGADFFRIHKGRFFKFFYDKLKLMEQQCIHGNGMISSSVSTINLLTQKIDEKKESKHEIDPESRVFPLYYQESVKSCRLMNDGRKFQMTNLGCYICQKNFSTQDDFEDHIKKIHQEEDYDLKSIEGSISIEQAFELSYRLCKASHYFCFQLKTKTPMKDMMIIDKIIIVQTCSMEYIENDSFPFVLKRNKNNIDSADIGGGGDNIDCTDSINQFYVDSHIFSLRIQQPIIIVYHLQSDITYRYIEKHLFWRTDPLPKVFFPTRSIRLSSDKSFKRKFQLPLYLPSDKMKKAHREQFTMNSLCEISQPFKDYINANKQITQDNIVNIYRLLLQIEDLDTMQKYLHLSLENVKIKKFGNEYSVKLQRNNKTKINEDGVLTPMDEILLVPMTAANECATKRIEDLIETSFEEKRGKRYIAMVEKVYDDCVCFKYEGSQKKIPSDDCRYNIIFRPSRWNLIYQHRALDLLSYDSKIRRMLFPELVITSLLDDDNCVSEQKIELFNKQILYCEEQLQAVTNIAEGTAQQIPYIVFGPPGTGKTTTIVESILQLWKRNNENRILVTAGSNSACDVVALRLCKTFSKIDPENHRNLLRIYSKSNEKNVDTIDDLLLESSNMYNVHFYPSVELIHEYRIIICTLSIVGKLVTGDFGSNGFFSHIFVDEVAASTEPEVLVGIMGTLTCHSQLVISGDHKQLGAVLQSQKALDNGLNISMMERLLARPCYKVDENGDYNRNIQTRLRKNYRSHDEIVKLYSSLYYDDELQAMCKSGSVTMALKWHLLPNENFPILFHSVFGRTMKNNTSSYNTREIGIVFTYLRELLFLGIDGKPIAQTDIGIISPYKAQCKLIQEELHKRHWYLIEVGSVETFQGKEKPIIIVSLVRSFVKTLGFLESPKRLNVTLSRAQSLLIIVGNPETLSMGSDYKYLIDHCRNNKSFVGSSNAFGSKENSRSRDSLLSTGDKPCESQKITANSKATTKQSSKKKTGKENTSIAATAAGIERSHSSLDGTVYKIPSPIKIDDILLQLPSVPRRHDDSLNKPTSIVKPIAMTQSKPVTSVNTSVLNSSQNSRKLNNCPINLSTTVDSWHQTMGIMTTSFSGTHHIPMTKSHSSTYATNGYCSSVCLPSTMTTTTTSTTTTTPKMQAKLVSGYNSYRIPTTPSNAQTYRQHSNTASYKVPNYTPSSFFYDGPENHRTQTKRNKESRCSIS